ncbi:response regulator [Gorillibacterium sp. sgz500922]|uniref:response regulator n=1 Tax=Gorillibacterium sp. sgz500922 TaxID=3446694 RepID=UPI003F67068F
MVNLMLVDDEEHVREDLLKEIDWEAAGFRVVGCAENGREAMELAERTVPDIVVTDIRMPFMDGLQLAEWLRSRHPLTRIVILTGFDEFDYAQKAIRLHIDEYVLKPFSAADLLQALSKVKLRLDEEIAARKNEFLLREHYRRSLPVLRESFLVSLVTRRLRPADVADQARQYGIALSGRSFVASVLHVEVPAAAAEDAPHSLRDSGDPELKQFAVYNIAEEIAGRRGLGTVFLHNGKVAIITALGEPDQPAELQEAMDALEEIRQSVAKFLKLTLTIGVGTETSEPADLKYSYDDAVLALDYRLIHGAGRVLWIGDMEKREGEPLRFDEWKESALTRSLKVGTPDEIESAVEQVFSGFPESASYAELQIFHLELLTAIMKAAKDAGASPDEETTAELILPYAKIRTFASIDEAKQWVTALCVRLRSSIANDRLSAHKNLVQEAIRYTREHFRDPGISIARLCEHLHISAGYFSAIFKKETKSTFVAFLLQLRMEEAARLLRTTDLRAFEISEQVGYSDPNYFSFCFKKLFSLSPKEYRSRAGGDGV